MVSADTLYQGLPRDTYHPANPENRSKRRKLSSGEGMGDTIVQLLLSPHLKFPALVGVDMVGTVVKIGPAVEGFCVGDRVFAMADHTYAELCVVKADILAAVQAPMGRGPKRLRVSA